MKNKKIILTAVTFVLGTLVSLPLMAQELGSFNPKDYHEQEEYFLRITDSVGKAMRNNDKQYLNVSHLNAVINEDLSIDYKKLGKSAANSIKDNKISPKEQYDLMSSCIDGGHNEILKVLLSSGFNPKVEESLNENLQEGQKEYLSLVAKSVIANNYNAFALLVNQDNRITHTMTELSYDMDLVRRFADFAVKYTGEKSQKPQEDYAK